MQAGGRKNDEKNRQKKAAIYSRLAGKTSALLRLSTKVVEGDVLWLYAEIFEHVLHSLSHHGRSHM